MQRSNIHAGLISALSRSIKAFTLIELLVVVIIIAVLAAVAMPMYQHAVLKSRFSTVMPMAKAVADAQEVYYLGNGEYALSKEELDITPMNVENTEVQLSTAEEDEKYNYVAAKRTDFPNARYMVYQNHSPMFAGHIHCEAKTDDTDALWLCGPGLGGVEVTGGGSVQGDGYKAFILSGTQDSNSTFVIPPSCEGDPVTTGGSGSPGATRTAECDAQSGKWVYGPWTGGTEYADGDEYEASSAYEYAGATFSGDSVCYAEEANACSYATFSGDAMCYTEEVNGCAYATFSGSAYCYGYGANVCAGSTFSGNAICYSVYENGCDDTTYTDDACCFDDGGGCPANAPICS